MRRHGVVVSVVLALALGLASMGSSAASPTAVTNRSAGVSPAFSTASGQCSRAEANAVVDQHPNVNIFVLPDPVRQVLCGPFTGPGSNAMAVTIGAPTCWPSRTGRSSASPVATGSSCSNQPAYLVPPLVAVGSDIRETTAVHRSGDSRCFFNGGTRARIWHWDGNRFTVTPWKQVAPGRPSSPPYRGGFFKTPSGNIVCGYSPGPKDMPGGSVGCGIKSRLKPAPPRRPCRDGGYAGDRVYLNATGRVTRSLVCG